MARIDFYVLQTASSEARLEFAIRLCAKACQHQLKTLVWLDNHEQATWLDEQLWTQQPESYLPHTLTPVSTPDAPILICVNQDIASHRQLLIQLANIPHPHWQSFDRTAEIVIQNPNVLKVTRHRYKDYKTENSEILMHNL